MVVKFILAVENSRGEVYFDEGVGFVARFEDSSLNEGNEFGHEHILIVLTFLLITCFY